MTDAQGQFPKVSFKPMEHGGFDVFCRGCCTEQYAATHELAQRFKYLHARCPDVAPAQKRPWPRTTLSEVD